MGELEREGRAAREVQSSELKVGKCGRLSVLVHLLVHAESLRVYAQPPDSPQPAIRRAMVQWLRGGLAMERVRLGLAGREERGENQELGLAGLSRLRVVCQNEVCLTYLNSEEILT